MEDRRTSKSNGEHPTHPLIKDQKSTSSTVKESCNGSRAGLIGIGVVLVAGCGVIAWVLATAQSSAPSGSYTAEQQACTVFCSGPLLRLVQTSGIFNDSKEFVDMPMRSSPAAILTDFQTDFPELYSADGIPLQGLLMVGNGISKGRVHSFLEKHFLSPGGGLVIGGTPPDWQNQPRIAAEQPNATVRAFALGANDVWKVLYREVNSTMFPDGKPSAKSSLIPPKFPVIVPGERFREQYYWDTLWIVRGLIRSGMNDTAKHMVENLIQFVEDYGFVPNGGRVYYLQRSQPPVLALMVEMVARMLAGRTLKPEVGNLTEGAGSTGEHWPKPAASWVRTALGALEKEYATFMGQSVSTRAASSLQTDGASIPTVAHATHAVDVYISSQDQLTCSDLSKMNDASRVSQQPTKFLLNRYSSPSLRPRPESYVEDVRAAGDAGLEWNGTAASGLYRAISTGAETGWDFSSRWLGPAGAMDGCHADSIVPVDLNTIMHKMETAMATMYEGLGDDDSVTRATVLRNNARRRATAMDCLMWDEGAGAWRDLRINVTSESGGSSSSGYGPFEAPASGVVRAHLTGQVTVGSAASDFFPLWGAGGDSGTSGGAAHSAQLQADGLVTNRTRVAAAVSGLFRSGLLGPGGVLTTTISTGQQWDSPNSWPPVLHVVTAGLSRAASVMSAQGDSDGGVRIGGVTSAQAGACAMELGRRYLSSAACAWRATGYLFEKCDALVPCQGGGGGEYVPQRGFGWTLGVALDLLGSYRWDSLEQQGSRDGGGPACVSS